VRNGRLHLEKGILTFIILSDFDTYDSNGKIARFFSLVLHIFSPKIDNPTSFSGVLPISWLLENFVPNQIS